MVERGEGRKGGREVESGNGKSCERDGEGIETGGKREKKNVLGKIAKKERG